MSRYKAPQIYVINNDQIAEKLNEDFSVEKGNLGVAKSINYNSYSNQRYINLQHNIIANLHEYEIIIIDLQKARSRSISKDNENSISPPYIYRVDYPQTVFDPAPLIMDYVANEMNKKCLRIIFADEDYSFNYQIAEIQGQNRYVTFDNRKRGIYDTIKPGIQNKSGKKFKVEKTCFTELLEKYFLEYKITFTFPQVWVEDLGDFVVDTNYEPLMYNHDGEVISYFLHDEGREYELLLPVCKDKEEFIYKLFTQVLPEVLPELFPESREFNWLNGDEFIPPEVIECEKQIQAAEIEYKKRMIEIEECKKAIYDKYRFLYDLLIQTGQPLVEALCQYFKWLGYIEVIPVDGSEEILREDIQLIEDDSMFIIEVKGIGGTSTDAECSQIAKHRRIREKENRDKNIYPIYIVNHQRYTQPQLRDNPPFSKDQIDYAENDERGLLTTWQLYKQYKLIEAGIFTKEETKEALKKIGLISLIPDTYISLGTIDEYYKEPMAGIIHLNDAKISKGDCIWARKEEIWKKGKIISIQVNDKDVDTASDGEIGLKTDIELGKGYELFIKNTD